MTGEEPAEGAAEPVFVEVLRTFDDLKQGVGKRCRVGSIDREE